MPVRPAVPAPKPLSPRAAQFVREIFQQENERQQSVAKAFDAGVASVTRPVAKASKADKSPMVAIYDADQNLVGMVDPDMITEIAQPQAPGKQQPPTDLQAAPAGTVGTPADAVSPTAKAMSRGAEQRGAHQLGGPTPRGGVPVTPAGDELAKAIANAVAHGSALKKQFGPNSGASAPEQADVTGQLGELALAAITATVNRPRYRR